MGGGEACTMSREDAAVGDPIADLAIARGDMSWGLGVDAVAAFTDEYLSACATDGEGEHVVDPVALAMWDMRAALRHVPNAAEFATGWQDWGRTDLTEEAILAALEQLVDAAMATLGW